MRLGTGLGPFPIRLFDQASMTASRARAMIMEKCDRGTNHAPLIHGNPCPIRPSARSCCRLLQPAALPTAEPLGALRPRPRRALPRAKIDSEYVRLFLK